MINSNRTRRQFLQGASAALMLSPLMAQLALGSPVLGRKLVLLNLPGGSDTLNMFPPVKDNDYYDLRPTIAIPERDTLVLSGSDLAMHPEMAPFLDIWNSGHMALFPAAHCGPKPNRSHFAQQNFLSRGGYTTVDTKDFSGWAGRFMSQRLSASLGLDAYDFYGNNRIFSGSDIPVFVGGDPSDLKLGGTTDIADRVAEQLVRQASAKQRSGLAKRVSETQRIMYEKRNSLQTLEFDATSVAYPSTKLGRQMKHAAVLLREFPELQVVQLARGGWDHHGEQGGVTGNQANSIRDLAGSVRAFFDDMDSDMSNVTVVVQTEFGRTVRENGSNGTDHGEASAWLVLGHSVKGGQYGEWGRLSDTRALTLNATEQVTDYREIYAGVLDWMGFYAPGLIFHEFEKTSTYDFMSA